MILTLLIVAAVGMIYSTVKYVYCSGRKNNDRFHPRKAVCLERMGMTDASPTSFPGVKNFRSGMKTGL